MSGYVERLRAQIGHGKVLLVYATAVIRGPAGEILCQRRRDFAWWGLPGGVLEPGETLWECCQREAEEETGLRLEPGRLVGLYTGPQYDVRYPNGDEVQQWTAAFECGVACGTLRPDGREITRHAFFPPGALPTLPPWYAAMVRDALAQRSDPVFEAPRAGQPRRQAGPSTLPAAEVSIWPAAAGSVRDEAGRVLLVRSARTNVWTIPGGLMQLGESVAETVVRCLAASTGLLVEPRRLMGVSSGTEGNFLEAAAPGVQVCSALFDCRTQGGHLRPAPPEVAEVRFWPPTRMPLGAASPVASYLAQLRNDAAQAFVR